MRSTFWPNRIFERQRKQKRTLSIIQVLFSCAARFGQIAFLSVKVLKIVKLASNSLQNRKTCENSALFMRSKINFCIFLKTLGFSSRKIMRSTFWPCEILAFLSVKVLKIVKLAWNSFQNGKTVRFLWKFCKTLFSCHVAARFGQIAFLSVEVLKIVKLACKFFSKQENSALSIKIV